MTTRMHESSVVAVYDAHTGAESAIKALQQAGFDMKQLSIVGKNFQTQEHAIGFYSAGDRMKVWGGQGAFWGSLWGMLFGSAFFILPVIGPIVVMGPLVGFIVGTLEGAAVGGAAGVLGAALTQLGIPDDSIVKYEVAVKAGKFLVLANGNADQIERARSILGPTGATMLNAHARRAASDAMQTQYLTRDSILSLLSDAEIAKVSTTEASSRLADGDEYLDLEALDQGVHYARAASTSSMGRVLPRSAVTPDTWSRILAQLAPPGALKDARPGHP